MRSHHLILFLTVLFFSCNFQKEKKNEVDKERQKLLEKNKLENQFSYSIWRKVKIELDETFIKDKGNTIYNLSRATVSEPSYVNVNVEYKNTRDSIFYYKASVIVKKNNTDFFGFRISKSYNDRVDAIFDLKNGNVKGLKKAGNIFNKENAFIEPYGNDGFYKCSILGEINEINIDLFFAPTSKNKNINNWEGKTQTLNNVYIYPNSLNVEIVNKKI